MKRKLLFVLLVFISLSTVKCFSQDQSAINYVDFTAGTAKYQGSFAFSFVHRWKFGAQQKLGIGLGARFTSYVAANQYYVTAPAQLTSASTSPLIIFKDNIAANIDTFLIKSPQVNSINLCFNIDYAIGKKI